MSNLPKPKNRNLKKQKVKGFHCLFLVTQDLEERARVMKMKMSAYRSGGSPAMSDTESYLSRGSHGDRPAPSRGRQREPLPGRLDRFERYERGGHDLDRGHHRTRRREYSK